MDLLFGKRRDVFGGEFARSLPRFFCRHGSLPAPPRLGSIAVASSFSFPSSSRAPLRGVHIAFRRQVGGTYRKNRRVARPCGFYIARPSRAPCISSLLRPRRRTSESFVDVILPYFPFIVVLSTEDVGSLVIFKPEKKTISSDVLNTVGTGLDNEVGVVFVRFV